MEEFEGLSDLQEIRKYLKKAQLLHSKLEEAQNKVNKIYYSVHKHTNVCMHVYSVCDKCKYHHCSIHTVSPETTCTYMYCIPTCTACTCIA